MPESPQILPPTKTASISQVQESRAARRAAEAAAAAEAGGEAAFAPDVGGGGGGREASDGGGGGMVTGRKGEEGGGSAKEVTYTRLFSKNEDVDRLNQKELRNLQGKKSGAAFNFFLGVGGSVDLVCANVCVCVRVSECVCAFCPVLSGYIRVVCLVGCFCFQRENVIIDGIRLCFFESALFRFVYNNSTLAAGFVEHGRERIVPLECRGEFNCQ